MPNGTSIGNVINLAHLFVHVWPQIVCSVVVLSAIIDKIFGLNFAPESWGQTFRSSVGILLREDCWLGWYASHDGGRELLVGQKKRKHRIPMQTQKNPNCFAHITFLFRGNLRKKIQRLLCDHSKHHLHFFLWSM